MPSPIYKELREQLDQYSCGFPITESGVELRILERLFTEGDAELFLSLSLKRETAEDVAKRLGRDPEGVASTLEEMGEKGLVFCSVAGEAKSYGALPFVPGIYELQLATMDRELAALCEQYFDEALLRQAASVEPFMRTVPVNRSVDISRTIATYDDSRAIVRGQGSIALANCICRVQQGLLDKGCEKPLEVCLLFGKWGQHYIDSGMARPITVAEALAVLDRAEAAGLVTQPSSSQNPGGMCNCCGECCAVLRGLNRLPRPAEAVTSSYFGVVDSDACSGCGTCLERCQMGAIALNDEPVAEISLDRCIGCGLCVTTCPTEALRLEVKPEDRRPEPVKTEAEAMRMMAQKRGKSLTPLAFSKTARSPH